MTARLNPHRRLASDTYDLALRVGGGAHALKVSLAYDETNGMLREIAFVSRGKSGQGLDAMLTELGIALSRLIQGRHPETGDRLP